LFGRQSPEKEEKMKHSFLIAGAFLLASFGLVVVQQNSAQEKQDKPKSTSSSTSNSDEVPYNPTPEDLAKKNPVPATPEGLAEAKKLYTYHCAMCHGDNGDGKGDLAADMKLNLSDWRNAATLAAKSDGELFYIVSNGKGKMVGGEGDRTSEKVRWNLVSLVRSFPKKDGTEKAKADTPR
jgi:mono/diheme cytochrome c family protein